MGLLLARRHVATMGAVALDILVGAILVIGIASLLTLGGRQPEIGVVGLFVILASLTFVFKTRTKKQGFVFLARSVLTGFIVVLILLTLVAPGARG